MRSLARYSIGIGDRFGLAAAAQLRAVMQACDAGVHVTPVWNKSNREHSLIGSNPNSVRAAAMRAVVACRWQDPWFVDADHISLATVDRYLDTADFFTIDVASSIGREAPREEIAAFIAHVSALLTDSASVQSVRSDFTSPATESIERTARKFLAAAIEAGRIYRHIESALGAGNFVTEVSMDETDVPQGPDELFLILTMLAWQRVPVQTIAPRFSGRFNKGVDYVGDPQQFAVEFRRDLAAIVRARAVCGLPADLKLSVHSGSDKYALYPIIRAALAETGEGVHLKTAGTTWLEELASIAEADDEGTAIAHEIYAAALSDREKLCAPYAEVIDIDLTQLPSPGEVAQWSGSQFASTLRHEVQSFQHGDETHVLAATPATMNSHFRQLLHVAYPVAAQMGERYRVALIRAYDPFHGAPAASTVTRHLWEHHLRPLFVG